MGFSANVASRIVCQLAVVVCLYGCCGDVNLSLGRFSGFMSGSFRLAGDIDIDGLSSFDLTVSIGGWAGVSFVTDIELDIDLSGFSFVTGDKKEDIDEDGADETVRVLVAVDEDDEDNNRVFLAWKGDEYTLDEGQCYLAWLVGETLWLASAPCDEPEGGIVCQMRADDESSMSCEGCDRSGACRECDADGKAKDCQAQARMDAGVPLDEMDAGVSVDADIDADIDGDIAVDAGVDGDIAGDADVDGSVSADAAVDASGQVEGLGCEGQVFALADEADACGLDVSLDEQTLCEQNPAEVGICYVVFQGIDALGLDTCSVVRDEFICGTVMNRDDPTADCQRRLGELVTEGIECGMTIELDVDETCSSSSDEVDFCYAFYDVARLAGEGVCAALGEILVCAVIN